MPHLTTTTEGNVLIVEMQRPTLSRQLQRELVQAWRDFEDDDHLRVAVLTGSGGTFSAGHDVEELASGQGDDASPVPEAGLFPMHLDKPVIAAVEGACHGLGFELALACDLRVAAEGASLGFPDLNLAVPYRVATVLLPRMTFLGQSSELLYSGRTLDASTAHARRLVNVVASQGSARAEAVGSAQTMAQRFADVHAFRKREVWSLSGTSLPYAMSVVRNAGPGAFA